MRYISGIQFLILSHEIRSVCILVYDRNLGNLCISHFTSNVTLQNPDKIYLNEQHQL